MAVIELPSGLKACQWTGENYEEALQFLVDEFDNYKNNPITYAKVYRCYRSAKESPFRRKRSLQMKTDWELFYEREAGSVDSIEQGDVMLSDGTILKPETFEKLVGK